MFSPLFNLVKADAGVIALLGDPPRVYAFGEAPQTVAKPYVVQQTVGGVPGNTLAQAPDIDSHVVQVDVYAGPDGAAQTEAKAAVRALVAVIEQHGYVVSWNVDAREIETRLWRISFTAEFITPR